MNMKLSLILILNYQYKAAFAADSEKIWWLENEIMMEAEFKRNTALTRRWKNS